MNAKNIFQTLAGVGYGLALSTATLPPIDIRAEQLENEVDHLSQQIENQNNFWNRFLLGLATGLGTALGATAIAGTVAIILGPIFKAVGIDIHLPG